MGFDRPPVSNFCRIYNQLPVDEGQNLEIQLVGVHGYWLYERRPHWWKKKNLSLSGPAQVKPMLFKGQLHIKWKPLDEIISYVNEKYTSFGYGKGNKDSNQKERLSLSFLYII